MSTPQVLYIDSTEPYGFAETMSSTFFEARLGSPEIGVFPDESLIAMFWILGDTSVADVNITSLVDNYGNVWTQVPGARISGVSDTGSYFALDCWRADNIKTVTSTPELNLTWTLSGYEGISGAGVGLGLCRRRPALPVRRPLRS